MGAQFVVDLILRENPYRPSKKISADGVYCKKMDGKSETHNSSRNK